MKITILWNKEARSYVRYMCNKLHGVTCRKI